MDPKNREGLRSLAFLPEQMVDPDMPCSNLRGERKKRREQGNAILGWLEASAKIVDSISLCPLLCGDSLVFDLILPWERSLYLIGLAATFGLESALHGNKANNPCLFCPYVYVHG